MRKNHRQHIYKVKSKNMKKDLSKLLIIGALGIVIVGGLTLYTNWKFTPTVPVGKNQNENVSLSIQSLYTGKQESISTDETVLQVLEAANVKDIGMQLTTKAYPSMGVLVTGMGILKNGADKRYWQYKVNGVMPQIGADQYKLKAGDSIEWFFATSQE